jgi:hypothetical protein
MRGRRRGTTPMDAATRGRVGRKLLAAASRAGATHRNSAAIEFPRPAWTPGQAGTTGTHGPATHQGRPRSRRRAWQRKRRLPLRTGKRPPRRWGRGHVVRSGSSCAWLSAGPGIEGEGPLRPKPTRSVPARRIIGRRPPLMGSRPGYACAPARRLVGRSTGTVTRRAGLLALGSLTDPGRPSRLAAVAFADARGPGRSQRRPRDGFSPSSLFSPGMPEGTPGAPVEARIATRPGGPCQPPGQA